MGNEASTLNGNEDNSGVEINQSPQNKNNDFFDWFKGNDETTVVENDKTQINDVMYTSLDAQPTADFPVYATPIEPTITTTISSTTTKTKTKTKTTTTSASETSSSSSSSHSSSSSSDSSGPNYKLYCGIGAVALVILFIIAIIVKKSGKKSSYNNNQQNYQTLEKPSPPKSSGSTMYSGPIYNPQKENQYATLNYNNTNPITMGVATSVDTASLQRKQKQEMDAAASAYKTGTLPNYNSPSKQASSVPPVPTVPVSSMPQTSMAQSYSNYNQPQTYNNNQMYGQGYDNLNNLGSYDQYNQPQQNYGYNQYGQQTYNNINNNTSPYGVQYGSNYNPGMSIDQPNVSSPLSIPVSTANGVIVSATYSSSQTTSVKQPDGTVTETLDYATSNSYEVDRDYVAIYSYEPNMTDELAININDRIHLLEMYSDGWGYGKNVTTGQIGILPLNRLKIDENSKKDDKEDPIEQLRQNSKTFDDISKRTVSMNKRPKAADAFDETKKTEEDDRKRRSYQSDRKKRYSDDDDYNRRNKKYDDDDYERRRDRRRYDDDDDYDYERRRDRDRRRYDDDDDYERRRDRDRRRYDDDDYDYERRRDRDRRRYDDDDDYERRRDRRRYDDDDRDRKRKGKERYDDDDEDLKKNDDLHVERKKSYRDESPEKSSPSSASNYERKKSYREDSTEKSSPNSTSNYERKKSYREDNSSEKQSLHEYERKKSYREDNSPEKQSLHEYERKKSYREDNSPEKQSLHEYERKKSYREESSPEKQSLHEYERKESTREGSSNNLNNYYHNVSNYES